MLAGVSHDLRTPLTRLRLALEMMPPREELRQDVAEMTADVEEMEGMVSGYLAFARGEGAEQAEPVDLSAVLEEVAAGARRSGAGWSSMCRRRSRCRCGPNAVRRAITNLVDNARRHAHRVALAAAAAGPHGVRDSGR